MILNSKLYNALKWVALILLPGFASFYLGFGQIWDFPETDKIVGSITLMDTFLGAMLQLSSKTYQNDPRNVDGYVTPTNPDPDTGIPGVAFTMSRHPIDFFDRDKVILKVGSPPAQPTVRDPLPEFNDS